MLRFLPFFLVFFLTPAVDLSSVQHELVEASGSGDQSSGEQANADSAEVTEALHDTGIIDRVDSTELGKALMRANEWGLVYKADRLLEAVPDVRYTTRRGRNALFFAAESGHLDIVKLLLAKHVSPDDSSLNGTPPLSRALTRAHWAVASALLAAGASAEKALNVMSEREVAQMLKRLRRAVLVGPEDNAVQAMEALKRANIPGDLYDLKAASSEGNLEVMAALLDGGVHPDNWAMREGIEKGNVDVVRLILQFGADPNEIVSELNLEGRTRKKCTRSPLLLAELLGHEEVAELLRENGARYYFDLTTMLSRNLRRY